jgi:Transposase DDE domain
MESLRVDQEVLRRLPLAESVLLLLRQATLPEHSLDLFERLRDRCYTRTLGFDLFVGLIRDALLSYGGSGRQAFEQARWHGTLEVSNQAVYGKLGCVPIALSEAFLAENTQRLLPLLPGTRPASVPASLRRFRVLTVAGKVTKRVTKRLKVLRGLSGGALGGKGLACLDMNSGLVIALAGCADGDANDCSLVAALMAGVTPLLDPEQECLIVADAQFADLTQPQRFLKLVPGGRSHFLLRYSAKTQFTPDPAVRPAGAEALLEGSDARGRHWRQEWGWLGRPGNPKRLAVRRVTLERPGEKAVAVLTDLLDPTAFPAEDLLECYLSRGQIEGVFQKITEVFSLKRLIASQPKGTVLQLSFCLLLYNLIQVVRAYVAQGQGLTPEEVSAEMLFVDVQKQLTALTEVVPEEAIAKLVPAAPTPAQVRARLKMLLGGLWKPIWRKTVNKKRRAHPNKPKARGHSSVHRVLQQKKREKASQLETSGP